MQEREQAQVAQYKEAMEAVRQAALAFEAVKEQRSEAFMAAFDHISGIIDSVFKASCSTSRALLTLGCLTRALTVRIPCKSPIFKSHIYGLCAILPLESEGSAQMVNRRTQSSVVH